MAAPAPRRSSRASRVTKPTNTNPDQRVVASVRYRYTDAQGRKVFAVPSRTNPELEYMVTADRDGRCRCNCPAGTFGHKPCAHATAVGEWARMASAAEAKAERAIQRARIERDIQNRYASSACADFGRGSYEYTARNSPYESGPNYYDPHGHIFD